jgi:hypothetical protein
MPRFDDVLAELDRPETSGIGDALAQLDAPEPEPQYKPFATGAAQSLINGLRSTGRMAMVIPAAIEAGGRYVVGADFPRDDSTPLGFYLRQGDLLDEARANAQSYDQRTGGMGLLQDTVDSAAESLPTSAVGLGVGMAAKVSPLATPVQQAVQRLAIGSTAAGGTTTIQEIQDDPRLENVPNAVAQGLIEGGMSRLGGATGLESVFKPREVAAGRWRHALKEMAIEPLKEAPEEGLTSGFQAATRMGLTDEQFNPDQVMRETTVGALAGPMSAAPMVVGRQVADHLALAREQAALEQATHIPAEVMDQATNAAAIEALRPDAGTIDPSRTSVVKPKGLRQVDTLGGDLFAESPANEAVPVSVRTDGIGDALAQLDAPEAMASVVPQPVHASVNQSEVGGESQSITGAVAPSTPNVVAPVASGSLDAGAGPQAASPHGGQAQAGVPIGSGTVASAPVKARMPIPEPDHGQGPDVLNLVFDLGGISSRPKGARKRSGAGEHDGQPRLPGVYNRVIHANGAPPDVMARMLYEQHGIGDGTPDTMWGLIGGAIEDRAVAKRSPQTALGAPDEMHRGSEGLPDAEEPASQGGEYVDDGVPFRMRQSEDRAHAVAPARVQAMLGGNATVQQQPGRLIITGRGGVAIEARTVRRVTGNDQASGSFDLTDQNGHTVGVIELRGGVASPATLSHELVHAMRRFDLITQPEWVALVRKFATAEAKAQIQAAYAAAGAPLSVEQLHEECVAHGIETMPEQVPRSTMRKIMEWLRRIAESLGVAGVDANRVAREVQRGEPLNRTPIGERGDGPAFAIRRGNDPGQQSMFGETFDPKATGQDASGQQELFGRGFEVRDQVRGIPDRLPAGLAQAIGISDQPLVMSAGDLDHIEVKHGDQIRSTGARDVVSFIADTIQHADSAYRGSGNGSVLLVRHDSKVGVIAIELERRPDAFHVGSAWVMNPDKAERYLKPERKVEWSRSAPANGPDQSATVTPAPVDDRKGEGERSVATSAQSVPEAADQGKRDAPGTLAESQDPAIRNQQSLFDQQAEVLKGVVEAVTQLKDEVKAIAEQRKLDAVGAQDEAWKADARKGMQQREMGQQGLFDQEAKGEQGQASLFDGLDDQPPGDGGALGNAGENQGELAKAQTDEGGITDFGEKIGGARKDTAIPTGRTGPKVNEDERPAWARRYEVGEIASSMTPGEVGKFSIRDAKDTDWKGQARQATRQLFDTRAEAEAAIPLIAAKRNHRVMQVSRSGEPAEFGIVREVTDHKRKTIAKGFATREEAEGYLAAHPVEIIETKTNFGEEVLAKPEKVMRQGPERRTGDVKPQDFMDTFGVRGVEFGNWNNQDERREVMNHAYDGLLDLAEVVGLPPKALAMNGDLALAFGARGHGLSGARAHYEPRRAVINLTKMAGAGALAHEWYHAFDHYLARQDGTTPATMEGDPTTGRTFALGKDPYMASERIRSGEKSGLRAALRAAFKEVQSTIQYKAERYVEDTEQAERFVGKMRDELKVRLDQARAYLARDRQYGAKTKAADAGQLGRWDAIADAMVNGDPLPVDMRLKPGDEKKTVTSRTMGAYRASNDAIDALEMIHKEVTGRGGRSAERTGPIDHIADSAAKYKTRADMLAEARKGGDKFRNIPTEFVQDAKAADQGRGTDYWSTPTELGARAFSAFVEDELKARGHSSDFMSFGSDNWRYVLHEIRPFPEGTERQAINEAMRKLVQTIKTEETDKGTRMFSIPLRPDQRMDRQGLMPRHQVRQAIAEFMDQPSTDREAKIRDGAISDVIRHIESAREQVDVTNVRAVLDRARREWAEERADMAGESRQVYEVEREHAAGMALLDMIRNPDESREIVRTIVQQRRDVSGSERIPEVGDVHDAMFSIPLPGSKDWTLTDPDAEARFQEAHGIDKESLLTKAREFAGLFGRQMTRHFEHLDPAQDALAIETLRRFEAGLDAAPTIAWKRMLSWVDGMKASDMRMFERALILPDVMKDIEAGLYDDKLGSVPFFGRNEVEHRSKEAMLADIQRELDRITANGGEELAKRVQARNDFQRGFRIELIEAGLLDDTSTGDMRYYHRQVLEHMKASKAAGLRGKGVRNQTRGAQKQRSGGGDFNTNYVESEFEYLSQMMQELAKVTALGQLKKDYDIRDQCRGEAKARNHEAMDARWEAENTVPGIGEKDQEAIDQGWDYHWRSIMAMNMDRLARMIGEHEITTPFAGLNDRLAEQVEAGAAKLNIDSPDWFAALAWLADGKADVGDIQPSIHARAIFKAIGEREQHVKQTLGNRYATWQNVAREQGEEYRIWQPEEGMQLVPGWSTTDKAVTSALREAGFDTDKIDGAEFPDVQIPGGMLRRARVVVGMKPQWVIPARLADQLESMAARRETNTAQYSLENMSKQWKQIILNNPFRVLKYNINNVIGDADIAMQYPGMLAESGAAAKDLWLWTHDKPMPPNALALMEEAMSSGLIGSGLSVAELPDISNQAAVRALVKGDEALWKRLTIGTLKLAVGKNDSIRRFEIWRESVIRLSAARFFYRRIRGGEKVYGASKSVEITQLYAQIAERQRQGDAAEVKKLQTNIASKLARELFIDYNNLSVGAQWARRLPIPFISWMAGNAPRYYRLIMNARLEGRGYGRAVAGAVGTTATKGAITAAVGVAAVTAASAAFSVLAYAFNEAQKKIWDVDDDEDPNKDVEKLFLILGRYPDGTLETVKINGALADTLGWFGLGNASGKAEEIADAYKKGETWAAAKRVAGDVMIAPVNKVIGGITPIIKSPAESALGKTAYPDIRNPKAIRDQGQYWSSVFGLRPVYDLATDRTSLSGAMTGVVSTKINPSLQSYYGARQLVSEWRDRNGISAMGGNPTERGNALYEAKAALNRGERDRAVRWAGKWLDTFDQGQGISGDQVRRALRGSIIASDPLHGVKGNAEAFMAGLNDRERKTVETARRYYAEMFLGDKSNALVPVVEEAARGRR